MAEVKAISCVSQEELLANLKLPPDDPLTSAITIFFSPAATRFLVPFMIGEQKLVLLGNPVMMAVTSDLFRELLPKLEPESSMVLASKVSLNPDQITTLLRVWLAINSLTEGVYPTHVDTRGKPPLTNWSVMQYAKRRSLSFTQLLLMWNWMNYFGVDLKGEKVRKFACDTLLLIDEIKAGNIILHDLTTSFPRSVNTVTLKISETPALIQIARIISGGATFDKEDDESRCWIVALAIMTWTSPRELKSNQLKNLTQPEDSLLGMGIEIPLEELKLIEEAKVAEEKKEVAEMLKYYTNFTKTMDHVSSLARDIIMKKITRVLPSGETVITVPFDTLLTRKPREIEMIDNEDYNFYVFPENLPPIILAELPSDQRKLLSEYQLELEANYYQLV